MTTIHLTDAQRDTLPSGYIVIDPDEAEGWRILTEPCDTCGGDPSAEDHPCISTKADHGSHCEHSMSHDHCHWCGIRWLGDGEYICGNPDCVGGRRVVTLTATCRWCEAKAINHPHKEAGHEGVVTLGRFTIPALLPVEKHRIGGWRQKTEGESWVYLYDEREATGYLDQLEFGGSIPARAIQFTMLGGLLRRVDLRLDPLPHPGQFVARPEPIPTQQGETP